MNPQNRMFVGEQMQPSQLSGMIMQPDAHEFVPLSATTVPKGDSFKKEQVDPNETNLVDEDTNLTITAENRLLAATSFEQMRIDSRFIKAL